MKTLGFCRKKLFGFGLISAVIFFTGSIKAMAQTPPALPAIDFCSDSLKNELLSSFHIDYQNDGVRISWASVKKLTTERFEIQRADKDNVFRTVGILFPDTERSDEEFFFTDKTKEMKKKRWLQYRVKVVNDNNTELYSCIQKIKW